MHPTRHSDPLLLTGTVRMDTILTKTRDSVVITEIETTTAAVDQDSELVLANPPGSEAPEPGSVRSLFRFGHGSAERPALGRLLRSTISS